LGGTKIEALALDGAGREVFRKRIPAPKGDYAATISAIRALIMEVESSLHAQGKVGIGIPGAVSLVTGLVKNSNSTWLIGKPLQKDLEKALARPVRLENDANCFALSEATDGAGKGAAVVFGVILGTGVGGGIVVHGKVLTGANAIAGEWGHNAAAPTPGPFLPVCYCGAPCINLPVRPGPRALPERTPGSVCAGASGLHEEQWRGTRSGWRGRLPA
jgi:fructokinase